ncbi:hypothetical protein BHU72_12625 [Desulfuribacillus stibiiarsenatis]|uniref:DUF2344 domain-containing protein n=1 Tax=Desulfuribacillus stibiiarsenatis TaxID=1390249 RepID=A0A1E5L257_9FIRM|nr:TIGR03936 family radical SAM-associated protein [Desulfuribacillus stibiiarsenatis]OEH84242.1 hypothetical protein BHU72_12625 [Desulfuribacillus stibiiarsenatis]
MAITIRARFSKGDALRYISHLDLQRMFGRALRRANIPVAYSQGFNPHPRLSFGSALGVGTTSESEFIDVDLAEMLDEQDFITKMNKILPPGFSIEEAVIYETEEGAKQKTLMSVINTAEYEIYFYPRESKVTIELEQALAALDKLNETQEWIVSRFSKKKDRELDIKPFVYWMEIVFDEQVMILKAMVKSGSEANVRPDELVTALKTYGDLPEMPYHIHRKKLGIIDETKSIKQPF